MECAVLYSQDKDPVIVSDVKFLLPLTDLFVAFVAHFLADQNLVSCVGGDLTFHFENKTFAGHSFWNMNLNGIINICTNR